MLVPLALTWMVGAVIALVIANYFSEQAFDRGMLDDAYALSANVQAGERGIELLLTPREVATVLFDQVDKVYFSVQRLDGVLISGQAGLKAPLPVDGARYRFSDVDYEGNTLRAVVLEHDAEPGIAMPYRVVIAQTTLSRTALVRQLLGYALAPQILLLVLLAVWLWYSIRSDLRPLGELQQTLDRRDVRDLSPVAVAHTSRELQRLGNAVNSLFERLVHSLRAQREFVGNVAHELRTPLANLIGSTQVALSRQRSAGEFQEVLQANLEDLERVRSIVNDMLFLARADRGEVATGLVLTPVTQEVRKTIEFFEFVLDESGSQVGITGDVQAEARLESALFRRAMSNLLQNAIEHSLPGAQITVTLREEAAATWIVVSNPGAAIDEQHLQHLFDRFYRVDAARNDGGEHHGHGLGLAIVKAVASMHGGQVSASSEGGVNTFGFSVAH